MQGVGTPNMSDYECVRLVDAKGKETYKFKSELAKEGSSANPESKR